MTPQPQRHPADGDTTEDATLPPSEATDSDEMGNDDETMTAPDRWQDAAEIAHEPLEDRLAAEEPDLTASDRRPDERVEGGRHRAKTSRDPDAGDPVPTLGP